MNGLSLLNKALSIKAFRYAHSHYKARKIIAALSGEFDPRETQQPFGKWLDERIVEYPWVFGRLKNVNGRLLDAGSVLNFDYLLRHSALFGKDIFISTLAPEKHSYTKQKVSYVYEDMRDICYKDEYFDCVVCISVIEHIGMDNTRFYTNDTAMREKVPDSYLGVVTELRRVLKPKGVLFMSIPFGEHRDYGWLQTFDGTMVDQVIDVFQPSAHEESYFRYQENGWQLSSRSDAARCQYYDFHDKSRSFRKDRAVAAEAVVLLELGK